MTVFTRGLRIIQVEWPEGSLPKTAEDPWRRTRRRDIALVLVRSGRLKRVFRTLQCLLVCKDTSLGDTTSCGFYQQASVGGNQMRAGGY